MRRFDANVMTHVFTGSMWHLVIGDDHVKYVVLQPSYGFSAVVNQDYFETGTLQIELNHVAHDSIVFGNKDFEVFWRVDHDCVFLHERIPRGDENLGDAWLQPVRSEAGWLPGDVRRVVDA